jgi:hypothetical protein
MSAPPFHLGDEQPGVVDGRPDLREWIAENLFLMIAQAEIAWRSLEIADDYAALYHVRKMTAHARQVIQSTNELNHREAA